MTTMSTNTRELDISKLVLTAYRYAGLMSEMQSAEGPQWDARSAYGRDQLELIIDALSAEGIFERSMEFCDVRVQAGAAATKMPDDTVDIRGDAALLQDDGTRTPLSPLSRPEYFEIASTSETGTPDRYYLARGAPMYLYLWPVPALAVTIQCQRQRLTFDNSKGAATVDLERYWMDYLLHELASRLALSVGAAAAATALSAKGMDAKRHAKGKSSDQLPNQFVMGHKAPRWRLR